MNTTETSSFYVDRRWHAFVFTSVIIYVLGFLLILSYRLVLYLIGRFKTKKLKNDPYFDSDNYINLASKHLYNFFVKYIHGQTLIGKAMQILSAISIIASILIYLIETTWVPPAERPLATTNQAARIIELIYNLYFLIIFFPKYLGSYNKLAFWLTLPTFADVFTIPPMFAEIALEHWWIGMRWVCFFRILTLTELFQSLKILKTATEIRLMELVTIFLCTWLSAAGCIHMLENSGDPSELHKNAQLLTYWESFYLILITMSTVGYGDLYCKTIGGRIFIMVFIIFAVALFASYIPEIIEIVATTRDPYNVEYVQEFKIRTLVIGGSLNYESVRNFVEDFTHPDRAKNSFKSIIFNETVPSDETLALIKSHTVKMQFIKGSMFKKNDLDKIKYNETEALIILTNLSSTSPNEEDMSNIMKAIAGKKHSPRVRVILQLLKHENKLICFNLPYWTDKDEIICLTEINNGFMATGCLVPGFCTLITNLFLLICRNNRSFYTVWQENYLSGAEMEIYSVKFSKFFYGKSLSEVVCFCYTRFKLLLVGVSNVVDKANEIHMEIIVNPCGEYFVTSETVGLFFCPSEEDTKGVKYYCNECHANTAPINITRCKCLSMGITNQLKLNRVFASTVTYIDNVVDVKVYDTDTIEEKNAKKMERKGQMLTKAMEIKMRKDRSDYLRTRSFDITGHYHWCADRVLEECILPNKVMSDVVKNGDHIILYSQEFPSGSLRSFILPLRTSGFDFSEIRTIVILVEDLDELKTEWKTIINYPNIYVSIGNPLNRQVLRGLNIMKCHMFVVTSGTQARMSLNDNLAILTTLNTKGISDLPYYDENSDFKALKKMVNKVNLNRQISSISQLNEPISILTEISNEKSIKYVDMTSTDTDTEYYMTRAYACGRVFYSRVFGTLTTSTFFSPESYKLAKVFITGTDSNEREILHAEGISNSSYGTNVNDSNINKFTIQLLPLSSGFLSKYSSSQFGKMFLDVYNKLGIMCIGIYRLISIVEKSDNEYDRFVLTNPHPKLNLDSSDLVYCLCRKINNNSDTPDRNLNTIADVTDIPGERKQYGK